MRDTCETCKHIELAWNERLTGCLKFRHALPPGCRGCPAHEPKPEPVRDWCDEIASTAWVRGLVVSCGAKDQLAKLIRDSNKQACKSYEYRATEEPKPELAKDWADEIVEPLPLGGYKTREGLADLLRKTHADLCKHLKPQNPDYEAMATRVTTALMTWYFGGQGCLNYELRPKILKALKGATP